MVCRGLNCVYNGGPTAYIVFKHVDATVADVV
jgi:hypothetical protein